MLKYEILYVQRSLKSMEEEFYWISLIFYDDGDLVFQ